MRSSKNKLKDVGLAILTTKKGKPGHVSNNKETALTHPYLKHLARNKNPKRHTCGYF